MSKPDSAEFKSATLSDWEKAAAKKTATDAKR